MSRLHIFIDGSWLYKVAAPDRVLAARTENPSQGFRIDFGRLNGTLLRHAQANDVACTDLGEMFLSTSVFTLPADFDSWPDQDDSILPEQIEQTKRGIQARNRFVETAVSAGYSEGAVYRPLIRSWILAKLVAKRYQEKQVDATVVALLVRSALVHPADYHCVITGDADILPAIRVAYPEYSQNVFVATTHPDELLAEHRQTAFSFSNFDFRIQPLYFQDHVAEIIQGENVYECAHCHKVFARPRPIPVSARPCCAVCNAKRT